MLLTVRDLQKHYGPEPVFDGVSLTLRAGEHRALVGPNGAGKTTLLRLLMGQESPDRGTIEWAPKLRIEALEQHAQFDPQITVWEAARTGLADLIALATEAEELASQLAIAPPQDHDRLANRLDRLHAELSHRDGYQVDHRIERVLGGVGFLREQFRQPASTLSGGQQHRLLLARLLLAEPDVLVLDEPTNHLDLESTAWLEEYLRGLTQAVIVVSHDRYFLDRVAQGVWELVDGEFASYDGGWTAYLRQRAERLAVQRQAYERWQEEAARLQDFIRRNQAGQKATQAADRQKKLDRLVPVARPREIAIPVLGFPSAERTGDLVLRGRGLAKSFSITGDVSDRDLSSDRQVAGGAPSEPQRSLFKGLDWQVQRGERWAILGGNGAGKTTLLKCLTGREPLDQGEVIWGAGVALGILSQTLEPSDARLTAIEAVWPRRADWTIARSRDLLGRFGISGDLAEQSLGRMSGGERTRVLLARLSAAEANVLLLDEPTNHLDVWTRQALEEQLLDWDGTLLFVSHDRYFVDRLATHILALDGGRHRVVPGDYQAFLRQQPTPADRRANTAGDGRTTTGSGAAVEPIRTAPAADAGRKTVKADATKRKRQFPYRKVGDLEVDILERESEIEHLSTQLLDPLVLRDGPRVRGLQAAVATARERLAELYAHYDEALELNG